MHSNRRNDSAITRLAGRACASTSIRSSDERSDCMNETHDPRLLSWVESANRPASDFPLQNLPWCSFRRADHAAAAYRAGIAIGDYLVDVGAALKQGLFQGAAQQA